MHPQEEGSLSIVSQPRGCARYHLRCRALDRTGATLGPLRRARTCVVHGKAAIKAGSETTFGVQRKRADECGRVITAGPKQVWNERKIRRETASEFARPVRLRIGSRENCRVRDYDQRGLGM